MSTDNSKVSQSTGAPPRCVTVKQYARMEQVCEKTVRRWIEKGAVKVRRTPGGGLRVDISGQ